MSPLSEMEKVQIRNTLGIRVEVLFFRIKGETYSWFFCKTMCYIMEPVYLPGHITSNFQQFCIYYIFLRSQIVYSILGSQVAFGTSCEYPNIYVAPISLPSHLSNNDYVFSTLEHYTLTPLLLGYLLGASNFNSQLCLGIEPKTVTMS